MMHAVSVTWLELFFDLATVVATHNIAVPIEHDISFTTLASYWLRVLLLWSIWHAMSWTVNMSNTRRRLRNIARTQGATITASQWLGWAETLAVLGATGFVTLMSNAALNDDDNLYYAYYCFASVVVGTRAVYNKFAVVG